MEGFVSGDVGDFNTQQIFNCARYNVALNDFIGMCHGLLERLLARFGMKVQADCDIGQKTASHLGAINGGTISGDDARSFQFLHAPQAG